MRGRKYPQDILPLLRELQFDKSARVRNTLVHVIGQIAYKKSCLETVIKHLKKWENEQLVADALEEIIDVHCRYRNFSALTQEQARKYIADNCDIQPRIFFKYEKARARLIFFLPNLFLLAIRRIILVYFLHFSLNIF